MTIVWNMCGIAGYCGFNNQNLLKDFSKRLAHRGPDGEGYFFDDNIGLLNRRLAIIDLKSGNQPIYNEDKSVVVVYNGEIYNYRELRKELEKKGHRFKTQSDTEVIVHSYEEENEECFDRFNGMFAIALYDIKKKKLILARDHFGIKPLYYTTIHNVGNGRDRSLQLMFSSEISPLFYSDLIKKEPNDRIIYRYLMYRVHDDNDETFFKGIKRLLPGELIIVRGSRFEVRGFSKLKEKLLKNPTNNLKVDKEKIDEFRDKLIKAIKLRLISDVPVGTCLSGGLDSSTMVAVVNKLLKEKTKEVCSVGKIQKSFSAVFPGSSNNEEKYVDKLMENVGTAHWAVRTYKIYPKPEEFFKELEDFVKTQEEPTISTGPYAQFKIMEEASKYVKVLLDGQGVDEMLAGYLPYYFVYLRQLFIEKSYLRLIQEIWGSAEIIRQCLFNQLLILFDIKKSIDSNHLLNPNFAERHKDEKFVVIDNNLKERLIEDVFENSLPALLRYEDRNSMRFSIEGRVPFLDFNLLQCIFNFSDEAIIKNGWNKNILRKAIKDFLPAEIIWRRNKIGFITPEHEWFMRMKNRIYGIFLSDSFVKRPYFNQQEVLKAFQAFIEGKNDDTMIFWRLLNLELWLRIFFDSENVGTGQWPVRTQKKSEFSPNEGKNLEINVGKKTYLRFPVKTDLFKKGDDVTQKIVEYTLQYINIMKSRSKYNKLLQKKWFIVVSEKIIAIAQGRSHFIWEIKPGFWAKMLSNFVTKTPYGIGLGSPWTMQLAINEVGLPRIILSTIVSQIGKLFGIRGLFYHVVGPTVRAIDGPTEYSLYPSNVSAKLGPKEPEKVAEKIHKAIISNFQFPISNFLGVVIIDANDLGQNVLANSTDLDNKLIEKIFSDNPMGQADEQTPIVVVISRS